MDLNVLSLQELAPGDIKASLFSKKELAIHFPLPSIGFSQSRIDIISDYSEISYCCEKIAPYIEVIDSGLVTRDRFYTDFKIRCKVFNVESLLAELLYFSSILTGDAMDCDRIEFNEAVYTHTQGYARKVFVFPELVNGYWANLVNGAYWEIAAEYHECERKFFSETYRKYPEQRFGFWKSPRSNNFKDPLYFSTECWIIPPDTNLLESLIVYSGLEQDVSVESAERIYYEDKIVLITNSIAVYFTQKEKLKNAVKCTELVLSERLQSKDRLFKSNFNQSIQVNIFGDEIKKKKPGKRQNYESNVHIDEDKINYSVSEFGDLILIEYNGFNYAFFSNVILSFEEIKALNSYLHPAYSKTQNLIDNSITDKCNWDDINDDLFEDLCYDILYCHPQFDSSTIKKMGKSRSRDGGRDITIKTKKTPTRESALYIFQCKYYNDKTSLSAAKISNAANVIMQYGAKGYGVFTTTVIDATLHDLLDGFSRNINIDTSFIWSKYELERYLNRHQMIKRKYFKK